jgi:HAE1 family hydrophobic/amphiphilic exporter-1
MAALMGTLPIALGFGAGAEARRALGVSVVGGLFFSQIVTLFLTPVVYINLDNAGHWIRRVLSRKRGPEFDVASSSGEAMSTTGHD